MAPFAALASLILASLLATTLASDPENLNDFFLPDGVPTKIDSAYFTFTDLREGVMAPAGSFGIKKVFVDQFPALRGFGVSIALLEFRPKAVNPPHTHPRATEILYVTHGILHVGFVDTNNTLFEQTLYAGDVFVFPKGLVHFQINLNGHVTAKAFAAFSSASPGVVSLPPTLFGSDIDKSVLEEAFAVDEWVVNELEKPFCRKRFGGHVI